MVVTKALTMVAAHGKQLLRHLVNLGRKKKTGKFFTDANGMNTGLQLTNKKMPNTTRYPKK